MAGPRQFSGGGLINNWWVRVLPACSPLPPNGGLDMAVGWPGGGDKNVYKYFFKESTFITLTKKYCVIAYSKFFIKWLRVSFRLWSITISKYFFGTMMIFIRGEREGASGGIVQKSCLLFTWESIRIIFRIIDAGLFLMTNCILMSQAH